MKDTRAAADMWWIIIGAVLALVILVVLLVIFTDKVNDSQNSFADCESKGGICIEGNLCPRNTVESSAFSCKSSARCCLGLPLEYPVKCPNDAPITSVSPSTKRWCP